MASSTNTNTSQQYSELDYKSGASIWFAGFDTNSPWGTTFPFSIPIVNSKAGVDKKTIAKPVAQQSFENDFVQISSNQGWITQSVGFGQSKIETGKKASNIPASSLEDIPLNGFPSAEAFNEEDTAQNLYKTELCRSFEETGTCRYGMKCQFAHGRNELRPVNRHPKYKTEVCKTFHTIGTCPYGKRCRFIHSELPNVIPPTGSVKLPPNLNVIKSNIKAPKLKDSDNSFSNLNSNAAAKSSWSNQWTPFPSATNVNVNINPVVKETASSPILPPPPPQNSSSAVNSSVALEPNDRRSRLGIFQQICS